MEVVNFADSARILSASFIDKNISIKSTKKVIEQDLSIYDTAMFSAANDVKTGGYSTLYLSEQKYGEDIIEFKEIISNSKNTIITTIANNLGNETSLLYINPPKIVSLNTTATCKFILKPLVDKINNTFFEIDILNERFCRIYHKINYNNFYLTVNQNLDVFFANVENKIDGLSAIDEYTFLYLLDKDLNKISLYKPISGNNYNLSIRDQKLTLVKIASASFIPFNASNTFFIQYSNRVSNVSPKINTSWASYKDIGSLEINTKKSAFKLKNNYLASSQYSFLTSDNIDINFFPLKNQLTRDGISQRGDYLLQIPNKLYPQTSLRDYEKIHIGSNYERGIDDISLTYTFYNTDYVFRPDEYSIFTTPESLYPYKQININDTLFAINGAAGGDSPHSADKIFTKNIKSNLSNTGAYLCTWLSGGNNQKAGLWVDRYYNSSKISSTQALTATALKLYDFTSSIEKNIEDSLITDDYFDIVSDLILEPSKDYIYQRLGPAYIETFIKHLENNLVFDSLSTRSIRGDIDIPGDGASKYVFNNKYHYSFIDQDVSSFTFSFWLDTDWKKPFGYQLAGNFNNKGFGVFNDESITPFIFVPFKESIFIYNTDFTLINRVDFPEPILDVVRINPLDDIYVITSNSTAISAVSGEIIPPLSAAGERGPLEPAVGGARLLYKLRSNGTIFDADILTELPVYTRLANTEDNIFFLLNNQGDIGIYNILEEAFSYTSVSIPTERGVSFDIRSIGLDRNNLPIGFRGEKSLRYNNDEHVFIYRNNLIVRESNDHSLRTILLSSTSKIYDFAIDNEENLYVLHNRFLSKYTGQRDIIYKTAFPTIYSLLAVDIVREYTSQGMKQYPIVALMNKDAEMFLAKIDEMTGIPTILAIDGPKGVYYSVCDRDTGSSFYNLTNYSLFLKNYLVRNTNPLVFRIELPNKYNNRDNLKHRIAVDMATLNLGKHHFVYRIDTRSGNITLFIDNKIYQNITFDPAEYALDNTLYNNFIIGAASYFNGILISEYLKQSDRYFCRNITIEQPKLYKEAVDDIDIKFISMLNQDIGELSVSVPCGERNQIEQIHRLFKWGQLGSKSNSVNIRIKGDSLNNSQINETLKQAIKREIQDSVPASVNINSIIFESY